MACRISSLRTFELSPYPDRLISVTGLGRSTNPAVTWVEPRSTSANDNAVNVFSAAPDDSHKSAHNQGAPPPSVPAAVPINETGGHTATIRDIPIAKEPLKLTGEELQRLTQEEERHTRQPTSISPVAAKRQRTGNYQFQII